MSNSIGIKALGRSGQPIISKNGKYIAIGNEAKIDIFDSDLKLTRSVSIPNARPYGNYAVAGISNDASKVYVRDWNGLFESGGGLYEINSQSGDSKRIDVNVSGQTITYQGWSLDENDIDFTSGYTKAVIAIRDTADSKTWGSQRVNIFLKDLASGTLNRIDFVSTKTEMGYSSSPEISNDGQKIIFVSDLDLTSEGATGQNIYLWDTANSFKLVNKKENGQRFTSNYGWHADLSGNGNKVAFQTGEALDPGDTNGVSDIYVKDLSSGKIVRASENGSGGIYPRFSNDGEYIFYQVYNMQDKYLKAYSLSSNKRIDVPGVPATNSPSFSSESFVSIANDSGIFWTWKDYSADDTDGDADYYYFSLSTSSPSYSLTPSAASINEGEEVRINISTTGVDEGTQLYWALGGKGIDADDFSSGDLKGSRLVKSDGTFSFAHTLAADKATEGTESLEIKLFSDWTRETQVGDTATVSILDTSIKSKTPTYSITPSTSSIDEKSESSVRFNISTTNVDTNTRLYYTLSGSGVTASDFSSGNIKSSRLIGSDGNATFVLSAAADKTTEGTESFNVKLYSDYQRTKLVATSSDVSIADTSKAKQSAALLSASVSAKTITLNFDSELSNTKPASQRFKVTADGKSIRISSSSLNADAGSLKLNLASAINPKQTVKLAYTDLKGDQSKGVLQTTDGTDLSSFSTAVSNNSSDSTAPTVTDATINGSALTLSFDEAIAKATPSNRSWTLKEDGKAISITSASVDSSSAQLDLTLSTAVDLGSNITLSYRDISGDQKANVIQDLAGNDLASFTNFSVENQTTRSSDPLDLNTAEINGNEIVLAFNRELSTTTPSAGTFRLRANNKAIKVNSITLSPKDREAVLKIASPVAHGDNVTLSYTDAQGNQKSNVIEDVDGNDLATISNFKLTNNTRKSATDFEVDYADVDGKIINLYLTDSLSSSIPKAARFRVTADNRKQKISSVSTSQSDGIITLSLSQSINPKQDVLISYRDLNGNQRSGVAEDTDGNDLASFKNLSPINDTSGFDEITDNNPPSLEDAYLDGKELILEFDKSLQTGKVSPSRFKLRAGKKRVRVTSALVPTDDDSTAILTLKSPLAASATSLSLTYKDLKGDQSSNIIQDDSGNDLASLRNFSVEII